MFDRLTLVGCIFAQEEPRVAMFGPVDGTSCSSGFVVASCCDGLNRSGLVNPMSSIHPDAREILSDPDVLFIGAPDGLTKFGKIEEKHRADHVKLITTQLRSGKLEFWKFGSKMDFVNIFYNILLY